MTNVLGISAFYHDSAAALVRDGEIVAAAQEERFSRVKHDARFPGNAVRFCLEEAGLSPGEVDVVAFYERPLVKFDRLIETYLAYAPRGFELFREAMPVWAQDKLHLRTTILTELPGFSGDVRFVDHHESHAASAFFPSPFETAAILTLDAVGEWSSSTIGSGRGNELTLSHEQRFPHSLGMLYSAFTYYAGFRVNSGEYKLMGLAPYGKPRYVDLIRDRLVTILDDGSLWLDMTYFNYGQGLTMTAPAFHDLFGGPPREAEALITSKEMDLAASIQVICEEVVLKSARHAHELTGERNLVMAGGVALNCVANGRLLREGPFENIWIQPAAGDAGGAIGAALLVWHRELGQPRQPQHPDAQKGSLLGPAFSSDDIESVSRQHGCRLPARGRRMRAAGPSRAPADRGEGDRVVPGPNGVRAACARLSEHPWRPPLAEHAAEDERQDQVPRILSAVRAVRVAGTRARVLRDAAGRGQPLHAPRGAGSRASAGRR